MSKFDIFNTIASQKMILALSKWQEPASLRMLSTSSPHFIKTVNVLGLGAHFLLSPIMLSIFLVNYSNTLYLFFSILFSLIFKVWCDNTRGERIFWVLVPKL